MCELVASGSQLGVDAGGPASCSRWKTRGAATGLVWTSVCRRCAVQWLRTVCFWSRLARARVSRGSEPGGCCLFSLDLSVPQVCCAMVEDGFLLVSMDAIKMGSEPVGCR